MRKLSLAVTAAATVTTWAVAAPAIAADLNVSVEIPRLSGASYHRPYVAVWIERPDNTAVRTLAVWYQQTANSEGDGKDWLKDMRTWWRRGGRSLALPADGVSSATKAPGRHSVAVPGARLSGRLDDQDVVARGQARELGGREAVRVPFRWGAANTARAAGSNELGAVSVTVTR